MKHHLSSLTGIGLVLFSSGIGVLHSQSQTPTLVAPTVFRMAGTLQTATGEPRTGAVVLVASLYNAQTDIAPLWSEAQTITLDQTGRYSILVGSSLEGGVTQEYFLNGTGRWLGVAVQGETEQPRIMLISVPYALKAVEADTLAGKTAADFVLAKSGTTAGDNAMTSLASTTNALAKFTDGSGTLGDSAVSEAGGNVAIPGRLTASGFGQHTFSASGTGANRIQLTNPTPGPDNSVLFRGDTDIAEIVSLRGTSSTYFEHIGAPPRAGAELYTAGSGGMTITAAHESASIRFNSGGVTEKMSLSPAGLLTVGGFLNVGGRLTVTGFGSHIFSAEGTGANRIQLTNSAAGPDNNVLFRGDTDIAEIVSLRGTSSTYAGSGSTPQAGAELYTAGSGGMSITAADASGAVRFYSGGTSERMRIETTGNVGIGTVTPAAKLDVNGNINASGNITATGNITAKHQDVAEWVETSTPLEPGTVVIVDPTAPNRVLTSAKAYDTRVAGAVSKQPGLILGDAGDRKAMVAQSGRVRIKVDARYGAIRVGDLLVTSPTPGHAMRSRPMMVGGIAVHRAGTLVGKALEALPRGKGEILVLLTLQ